MDATEFLTRIVASGAFYAFAYRRLGASTLSHRFFPQPALPAAVDWLKHIANEADVWHAVASFRQTRRLQANAENLRCFWYDADISRPGDGKPLDKIWKDIKELIDWLGGTKASLPLPNIWIASGYGVHLYWVLNADIPAVEWTEHAKKFRALLGNLGARGDISISADSARILRPPGTFNYKVVNDPKPCRDITPAKLVLPATYDSKIFLSRLGLTTVVKLGPRPGAKARVSNRMLDAAKANLSRPPPADFMTISRHCLQVGKSLAEHGKDDTYGLWHLLMNLAYFCNEREGAHEICSAHHTYTEADADDKLALTEKEHNEKGTFGAPSCESFDIHRKGVCDNCQHFGKIKSPYSLGFKTVLPEGYYQGTSSIQRYDAKTEEYIPLVTGEVNNPQLFHIGGGIHRFVFDYSRIENGAMKTWPIELVENESGVTVVSARNTFVNQGISLLRYNALPFSDFVMAWINELRAACKTVEAPPSFGWIGDGEGGYLGISVAGTFYRCDGTETLAQPGDLTIHKNYQPIGNLKTWRRAAEFVIADRPELQTLVAASFAAPLMEFVGESGILSVWSAKSGARKTSAFRVGTAVWCNPITGMSAIRDTTNSVQQSLAETRIMPVFWDEIHTANKEQVATMVEMFFNITQGRGRARLDQRMEQRTVGYWRTLLTISANKASAESIEQDRSHTNAGTIRVFEYHIDPQPGTNQDASSIVQTVEKNYGHAGRVFAQWLANNLPTVQATIKSIRGRLYRDVPDIKPEERFHVAVIVGIAAGAVLVSKLNLITLDVPGIYKFLKQILYAQRKDQQNDNPSGNDAGLLSSKFERFIADHTEDTLVTQSFSAPGRPKAGIQTDRVRIIKQPSIKTKTGRALIHTSLDDGEMRVDYNAFKNWCQKNNESRTTIINLMVSEWSVERVRAVLAIGTEWSSGAKVYYLKLNLNLPGLQHHLAWGTPATPSNVVPFPPAAQ